LPVFFVFVSGSKLKGLGRKQSLTENMSEIWAAGRSFGGQDRKGLAVTGDAASAWFLREILPLEAILMHYLQVNWRNASDVADLRQEVYTRVFEAARESIPDNPKRFLLTCARNLLIDLVRREQVVPMETFADFEALGIATDAPQPDHSVIEREELRRLEAAVEKLPARTREAIALAYFDGLTGKEIAQRMNVTQSAASHLLANGALILGDILYGVKADRSAKS
jgi:RNA polymerase sigma factor (sigma-70 family)